MLAPGTTDERFWSRYLARRDARCPACGYSLRGGRSPICAECAHVTSLHELRTHADPTEESWHRSGAWALTATLVFGLVPGAILSVFGSIVAMRLGGPSYLSRAEGVVMFLIGAGLLAGPGVLVVAWRRGARWMHRRHDAIKWLFVTTATLLAVFSAMLLLASLAMFGLGG